MSIRTSRFYNNPAIGQAFENLAAAFAPPSGADAAGWATANAKREEAARLQELFNYARDPSYDQTTADRLGVLGGLYAPTQSFHAVNQADATTRRGQDVSAAASRYGSDRTYAASTENNVRDNARAIQTNDADNVRALQDRSMQEAGALQRLYAAPVTVAQGARTFLPAQTAEATGLPSQLDGSTAPLSESQQLAQIIASMPIEQQQRFVIDKMAPTETQVQGQERRDLRESGLLTDENLVESIMGSVPVENVVGPDGKPVVVSRPDAIGKTPFINPGAQAAPQTENWVGPDGKGGTAVFDTAQSQWVDTSTRQPIPQGSRTYTGQLQGGAGETGFGPTTANRTEANSQRGEVTRALANLDIYEQLVKNNPGSVGLAGLIRGTAQNALATADDLARSFGDKAPAVMEAAQEMRAELGKLNPDVFDPSIPQTDFLENTLAYALARANNPSGEVSRTAYEAALRQIRGGGLLANTQSAQANIDAARQVLQSQLQGIDALQDPSQARTDTANARAGAPASPAPAPGGAPRKRYNPQTGAFE